MKLYKLILFVLLGWATGVSAQAVVPSSAVDVLFVNEGAAAAAVTTINATDVDSSTALNISSTSYQSMQYFVSGTTPRLKIEVFGSMQDVDSTYVLVKTIEDSTQEAAGTWSAPISFKVAGMYFRRYHITGLATNGANTQIRIKEYLINMNPSRR